MKNKKQENYEEINYFGSSLLKTILTPLIFVCFSFTLWMIGINVLSHIIIILGPIFFSLSLLTYVIISWFGIVKLLLANFNHQKLDKYQLPFAIVSIFTLFALLIFCYVCKGIIKNETYSIDNTEKDSENKNNTKLIDNKN